MIAMPTDTEPVRVVTGDALDVLRDVPNGSISAVVCDPPYPHIRRPYGYWTEAEWFALMNPVVEECRRVLTPTGSAVFVLQPNSKKVGLMRTWLWRFMADWGDRWGIVQDAWWWNTTAIPDGLAIQGRLMRASVKACVWLGSPDCYRDQDSVLWSEADSTKSRRLSERARGPQAKQWSPSGHGRNLSKVFDAAERRGGVTPMNVIPTSNHGYAQRSAGSYGHGAGTPLALCRWWVRYICPPGGAVLDPFLGSGTVALAALAEGRKCIGVERHPPYADIARRRVAEALARDKGSLLAGVV